MIRQPVTSSNLASVGYDPASQVLEVEFSSGAVWQYSAVPQTEYEGLMGSSSPGSYFAASIRGNYSGQNVG